MTGAGRSGHESAIERIDLQLGEQAGPQPVEVEVFVPSSGERERQRLGRWAFTAPTPGPTAFTIDWLAPPAEMVSVASAELSDFEHDPVAVVRPAMEVEVRAGGQTQLFEVHVTETAALERYYKQDSHQDEYVVEHPFFHSFHEARLRTLGSVFRKYIQPGSRVLDVGSGYSIFFLITTEWEFDITCCDLDSAAMEKMRGLVPAWRWIVADATELPFDDASFDAVYAGEIIEHVTDAGGALAEWGRVLEPGGVLIVSTPNRERLLARANRREMPVHHEHVREMSLSEAEAALGAAGFDILYVTGIYLELLLNWYRPSGFRVDMLVSLLDEPRFGFAYRAFMWMGRLAPSRAFDLVMVCRKR